MADLNFTKVTIKIPEVSNKWFSGKLYIEEAKTIKIEFELKGIGNFNFDTLECIYAKTFNKQKISLIGCFPIFVSENIYIYSVNEVHYNLWVNPARPSLYSESHFEVSYLANWFPSSTETIFPEPESDNLWKVINIKKPIRATFQINKNTQLTIYNIAKSSYSGRKITLETSAYFSIKTKKLLSKNSLFKLSSSFINLFSLFVASKIYVHEIKFINKRGESHDVVMNFHGKPNESNSFEIQIPFKQLEPYFSNILQEYYSNSEKYNRILKRIRNLNFSNEEQSFLTLCKCIEVFHKDFIEQEHHKNLIKTLANEFVNNGVKVTWKNGWNQIIRYLHLYKIFKPNKLNNLYSKNEYDFIEKIKNTRNYYTHPEDTNKDIWAIDEMKRVNFQLKIWLKGLILKQLHLKEDLVQQVLAKELKKYLFLNSQLNTYSIFYDPPKKDNP